MCSLSAYAACNQRSSVQHIRSTICCICISGGDWRCVSQTDCIVGSDDALRQALTTANKPFHWYSVVLEDDTFSDFMHWFETWAVYVSMLNPFRA